jgi:hypothetical protein
MVVTRQQRGAESLLGAPVIGPDVSPPATGSASAARSVDRAELRRPELLATRPALLGFGLFG